MHVDVYSSFIYNFQIQCLEIPQNIEHELGIDKEKKKWN